MSENSGDEVLVEGLVEGVEGGSADVFSSKNRKPQFRFSPLVDKLLLQETLAHDPFVAEHGSVGQTWARVAETMDVGIDGRRCRERVTTLVRNHRIRVATLERDSGIEEEVTEFDRLLTDISELMETQQEASKEKKTEKAASAADAERRGEKARQLALEGMSYKERKRGRDEANKKLKERELDLAERKLALEERQLAMAEVKARLEAKERKSMIQLIASIATKTNN